MLTLGRSGDCANAPLSLPRFAGRGIRHAVALARGQLLRTSQRHR